MKLFQLHDAKECIAFRNTVRIVLIIYLIILLLS